MAKKIPETLLASPTAMAKDLVEIADFLPQAAVRAVAAGINALWAKQGGAAILQENPTALLKDRVLLRIVGHKVNYQVGETVPTLEEALGLTVEVPSEEPQTAPVEE